MDQFWNWKRWKSLPDEQKLVSVVLLIFGCFWLMAFVKFGSTLVPALGTLYIIAAGAVATLAVKEKLGKITIVLAAWASVLIFLITSGVFAIFPLCITGVVTVIALFDKKLLED